MQARELLDGHPQQPVRVGVAERGLVGERKVGELLERVELDPEGRLAGARAEERAAPARGSCSAGLQITGSEAALVGVPVLFEVADERGAQVAIGLLAAEGGHVLPEDVERLRPDA